MAFSLVVVVGENVGAEVTDFIVPYGVLKDSGVAEVRSLSQRSANAAKEIKSLITDSVEKVDSGSKLVGNAGQTMEEIVNSVNEVAGFMSDIATSSREQSVGIAQVNETIAHFESMTEENAALVEQNAAASESLKQQASRLVESE